MLIEYDEIINRDFWASDEAVMDGHYSLNAINEVVTFNRNDRHWFLNCDKDEILGTDRLFMFRPAGL